MAEIKIRKKTPKWPYYFIIVILSIAALYFLFLMIETNEKKELPNVNSNEQVDDSVGSQSKN